MTTLQIDAAPARDAELDALAALVRRHQLGLWRYLRSLGCAPALAEELAQDTFLLLWQKGFTAGHEAATRAYLVRCARHLWLRSRRAALRHEARMAAAVTELWQRRCADDDGDTWLAALRECLTATPPRTAAALQLFYGESRSRAATAAALGLRQNGLKTLLQRARAALRRCIEARLAATREG
ncbi:MAG TPA: RNA polymerase sigma factor [Planctomycetota bacterium]|nr:RNA polymerase sigma factor [Planctomycetota bacterium]